MEEQDCEEIYFEETFSWEEERKRTESRRRIAMAQAPVCLRAYLRVLEAAEAKQGSLPPAMQSRLAGVFSTLSRKNTYMYVPLVSPSQYVRDVLDIHQAFIEGHPPTNQTGLVQRAHDGVQACQFAWQVLGLEKNHPVMADCIAGVERAAQLLDGMARDLLGSEFFPRRWEERPSTESLMLFGLISEKKSLAPVQKEVDRVRMGVPALA